MTRCVVPSLSHLTSPHGITVALALILPLQTILCPNHTPKIPDNVLTCLSVFRRVYVSREEEKQIARYCSVAAFYRCLGFIVILLLSSRSFVHQEDKSCVIRVGSLIVYNIGQLLPNQIHSGHFNSREFIYPVSSAKGFPRLLQALLTF